NIIPKKPLREYGVTQDDLKDFTEVVITEQGRLMANNYVELKRDVVYDIYQKLL
ncbi:MAG: 4-hydroxybutyrate dehydrogenase, partial [Anaerostipes sp.]|nr:4-hydroxybutyrate dehydrogenase [Anaerostipes sp.]